MQEQHEVLVKKPLLDDKGNIAEPGYAKRLNWEYDNKKITAKRTRLKEWDYYYISNKEYALCLTIADMGYVGALSISVIDFVTPTAVSSSSQWASSKCLQPLKKVIASGKTAKLG